MLMAQKDGLENESEHDSDGSSDWNRHNVSRWANPGIVRRRHHVRAPSGSSECTAPDK